MASVGIVGGLGVGATVHYYERIAGACKARGVVPDLVIVHADVDYGQGLVRAGTAHAVDEGGEIIRQLVELAGAAAAAIPAVTPHICIAETIRRTPVPIISIVDPIAAELRARKLSRVALFGTTFTMEGGLWGLLSGVEIVKPQPDEIAFIGQAYQRILDTQRADAGDAAGLRGIAHELQRRDGVEAILLAGTDLAVMFDETTAGFPAIDVARLHIDAIVERLAT